MEIGYLKGDICNRDGCIGIIEDSKEGSCSCHINPPCSSCTDSTEYCSECGWYSDDDYEIIATAEKSVLSISIFNTPKKINEVVDDGKLYQVNRYFDDHYEATVGNNLSYPDAIKLKNKFNAGPRHYVYYAVQEQIKKNE